MTIEATEGGGFVVTGDDIKLYQAMAVKAMLGMDTRFSMGRSAAAARATAKGVFGCTGRTSKALLAEMTEVVNKMQESRSRS